MTQHTTQSSHLYKPEYIIQLSARERWTIVILITINIIRPLGWWLLDAPPGVPGGVVALQQPGGEARQRQPQEHQGAEQPQHPPPAAAPPAAPPVVAKRGSRLAAPAPPVPGDTNSLWGEDIITNRTSTWSPRGWGSSGGTEAALRPSLRRPSRPRDETHWAVFFFFNHRRHRRRRPPGPSALAL